MVEGSRRATFLYDYLGRRVQKQVFTYTGDTWQRSAHRQFVYDGWNLIEEMDLIPATPVSKYYVWGLDLSESFQGAGGIGGLITVINTTGTDYASFDGNGNLGQLVDAGTGQIVAHYEYDPFGNTISSMGDHADDNPFRYSTKYHDIETDLYYYGYRSYSPELGQWLNRDPTGEFGGLNLYGFNYNDPINWVDPDGYSPLSIILKQAAKKGIKEGLEHYIKTTIKKKLGEYAGKKAGKQLLKDAYEALTLLDTQWWELVIECVPVGGDIYGAGKLAMQLQKVNEKLKKIEKAAERLRIVPKSGTKLLEAPKLADHHIFPQQFKKFFKSKGVDIDELTMTLGQKTHLKGLHGKGLGKMPTEKWNTEWKAFIDKNPSTKEIYQKAGEMIDKYDLGHVPIHPYKK